MKRYVFWLAGTIFLLSIGLKLYIIILVFLMPDLKQSKKNTIIVRDYSYSRKNSTKSVVTAKISNKNINLKDKTPMHTLTTD